MTKLPAPTGKLRIAHEDEVYSRIHSVTNKLGLTGWARRLGVTAAFAHHVVSRVKPPSNKVLADLGLRRIYAVEVLDDPQNEDEEWKMTHDVAPCPTDIFLSAIKKMNLSQQMFVNKINWWIDRDFHAAMDGVDLGVQPIPPRPRSYTETQNLKPKVNHEQRSDTATQSSS